MKIFIATYRWSGGKGAWEDGSALVVANTKSEGLGLILEKYPETQSEYWALEKINVSKSQVYHITEDSC